MKKIRNILTWNSGHCGEGAARSKSDPNYYAELVLDDAVDAVIFVVVIINVVAAYVAVLQSQDQARPTAWGGWGYCDTLCSKAKTFGWEGQLKLLEVSTPLKDGIIWRKKQYEPPHLAKLSQVMRKVSSHRECESFLRGRGLETQLCLFQEQDLRSLAQSFYWNMPKTRLSKLCGFWKGR